MRFFSSTIAVVGFFHAYAALILALDSKLLPEPNAPNDFLSLVHGENLATDAHRFLKLRDPVIDPAGRMPRPFPAAGAYFLFEFMLKNFSQRCLKGC